MSALQRDAACVELRGLVIGVRRAWRLRVAASGIDDFGAFVTQQRLSWVASDADYADIAGGLLRPADDGLRLLVVAVDADTAHACIADEVGNAARRHTRPRDVQDTLAAHRRLGAAYGYPDCCVAAFCDAHLDQLLAPHDTVSANAHHILRSADRSERYLRLLAALPQWHGQETASPLRHLPCRFDCAASLALAESLLRDLRSANPTLFRAYGRTDPLRLRVAADGEVARVTTPIVSAPPTPALGAMNARFPVTLVFV